MMPNFTDTISLERVANGERVYCRVGYPEDVIQQISTKTLLESSYDEFCKVFIEQVDFTPKFADIYHILTINAQTRMYAVETRWRPVSFKARLERDGYIWRRDVEITDRDTPYYTPLKPQYSLFTSTDAQYNIPKLKFTCAAWDNYAFGLLLSVIWMAVIYRRYILKEE